METINTIIFATEVAERGEQPLSKGPE